LPGHRTITRAYDDSRTEPVIADMSQAIHVTRVVVRPIEPVEVLTLIEHDPELELSPDESADLNRSTQYLCFRWQPRSSSEPVELYLAAGQICAPATPSDATLEKLRHIAGLLQARVLMASLDDIDLTDAGVLEGPEFKPSYLPFLGCTLGCLSLLALVAFAMQRFVCV